MFYEGKIGETYTEDEDGYKHLAKNRRTAWVQKIYLSAERILEANEIF